MLQYKLTTLNNMLSDAKTNNNNKRIKNVLINVCYEEENVERK